MIYEAFLGMSGCVFLFYDSILDLILHVYNLKSLTSLRQSDSPIFLT